MKISSENRTIGTYCGQQSGQSILVVGNYAVLAFHSDGIIRHRGYELFFSQVHSGKHDYRVQKKKNDIAWSLFVYFSLVRWLGERGLYTRKTLLFCLDVKRALRL